MQTGVLATDYPLVLAIPNDTCCPDFFFFFLITKVRKLIWNSHQMEVMGLISLSVRETKSPALMTNT